MDMYILCYIFLCTNMYCTCNFSVDIDDHFDMKSELLKVAHNWKGVGEALRLKHDLLSRIEADKHDVINRLDEVLIQWLNKSYNTSRFGPPSWRLLVAAVAHPAGGNDRALAEQIAAKYNGKWRMDHVSNCVVSSYSEL